jgi:GH35 family endo-1,4-beta-xylanase
MKARKTRRLIRNETSWIWAYIRDDSIFCGAKEVKRFLPVSAFLVLFALLLSGCLSDSQPTAGFHQRADEDISFQRTTYLPLLTNAHSIELGTAIHPGFMWDERYTDSLATNFDRVTPEVAGGYWYVYGLHNGWQPMDAIVQIAEENNQEIFYHCLRWWWEAQPPDIRIWITEAMTRYPTITDWVVVNEGCDYYGNVTIPQIDESFVIAREIRPDARLWYNGLLDGVAEQQQAIRLVQLGYADAIGIQMHLNLYSDIDVFRPLLDWLQANNVAWAITELDVIVPVDNAYYRDLQAHIYGQVVELFLEYGGEFISMWGVSDAVSWQKEYFPLPIDINYLFKPAWYMLAGGE